MTHLKNISKIAGHRGQYDFMSLQSWPICTSKGYIDEVMPGVEVAEGASHVDREVVPLQAVLLCRAPHAVVVNRTV